MIMVPKWRFNDADCGWRLLIGTFFLAQVIFVSSVSNKLSRVHGCFPRHQKFVDGAIEPEKFYKRGICKTFPT